MIHRLLPPSALATASMILFLLALSAVPLITHAFPIIAEVEEDTNKCFRFNVPEDDDAHMVFVALPDDVHEDVEDWYVATMNDMTRKGGDAFMKDMPEELPKEIVEKLGKDVTVGDKAEVYLKVQKPRRPVLRHQMFRYFHPIIMKDIVRTGANVGQGWDQPLGGYSICFENQMEDREAIVMFDVVLVSEKGEDDDKEKKKDLIKKEHLTPLEKNFQASISTANQILNEMHYMEKREARMRHTAESTNVRIRYFSYLSVAILLGVTWMQVTYLKSYFKKKKLM